ncbi:zinc finger and BTB domain-containing protein 49-like isoform X1 [Gouania willdenowi]|uniref:zinc finger and BTB domain-containing protein 49-like isoform X1 n=1 Tax=Gouania willdenowi TaxID=441366 RepID=UPI00105581A6|nr:zinc finger and BTB domain-containing protein 49-like isoform X1 [Gouania willdenowi]
MLSGVTLRAQIASVIDALSKAAAAEIAKVVEDGMVVLRLEVCQRENEIQKLKSNIQLLHGELRAVQQLADTHGPIARYHDRDDIQPLPNNMAIGDQTQLPEVNPGDEAPLPDKEKQATAQEDQPIKDSPLPTPVQPKPELAEKNQTQSLFPVGNEPKREKSDDLSQNIASVGRDSQQWTPRTQHNPELSSTDSVSGSAGNTTSFSGNFTLQQPPMEESCAVLSFPEKLNTEPRNSAIPHTPYHSSDTLITSREVGFHGVGEASLNDYHQQRSITSFQGFRPKRYFTCSYCSKVFERAGHLERHLRIHTGEKPYGCQICGRFFNQKSSLKGHMNTHKEGESTDLLESHHLTFTMPDGPQVENLVELKNGLMAQDGEFPHGVTESKETVTVKQEPNEEDLQTVGHLGVHGGTEEMDQSQLWASGSEKNSNAPEQTVCVLLPDASTKDKHEATCNNNQYLVMGFHPKRLDSTHSYEPHDQQSLHENDYNATSDGTHNGEAFEFKMDFSSNHEDQNKADAVMENTFICASCGQSFGNFDTFQGHLCDKVSEQL